GFHRMEQSIPGPTRYLASSGIGGTRIRQPEVALEHRQHLRREKAALRLEVTRPFAAVARDIRQRGIEEHDRLGVHRPVLDATEAERIDIAADLDWRAAEKRGRIGKARSVHLQLQP